MVLPVFYVFLIVFYFLKNRVLDRILVDFDRVLCCFYTALEGFRAAFGHSAWKGFWVVYLEGFSWFRGDFSWF